MNCEEFQNQIGAARDGELDDAARLQLEAHLAECCECREASEGLERVDAMLRGSIRPLRRRAEELAAQVTLELSKPEPRPATRSGATWPRLAAAVAAGFLIACLVFQPWRDPVGPGAPHAPLVGDPRHDETVPPEPEDELFAAETQTVAQFIASTGPIDVRLPDQTEWDTVTEIATFTCPSGTSVKTPRGSLCELATTSGSVVRMRDETEVRVRTADELELSDGHVWLQVPESGRFVVTASEAVSEAVGPAVMMQCVNPDPLTVTSCTGSIDVGCGSQRTRLAAGGCVQLVNGSLVETEQSEAPLLADAWMHPLLMRKGHDDPELQGRVDAMLARIGNMKLALMYEQQIRGLGEYAALPLLRFIEQPPEDADEERRARAARILADIAPVWMVPDLIGLLGDDDPRIRSAADQALVRLTGRESGMTEADWAGDQAAWTAKAEEWNEWWSQFEERYTSVPGTGDGWGTGELLYQKARN